MALSGVASHPLPEYNYDPQGTGGMPLGTLLSRGMVSPGMVLAYESSRMACHRMPAPPHSQVSYGSQESAFPETGQYPPPPPPPQNNGYGGY